MRRLLLFGAVAVVLAVGARGDEISLFGSPTRGMAGAGIALLRNPVEQMYLNPAAAAYVRGIRFGINNLNVNTENITIRQIQDTLTIGQKGIVDLKDAARIIRTFGDEERVRAVFNADFGFVVNGLAVTAGALGDFRLHPNLALRRWVKGESDDLSEARGDLYGVVAFSLPEVTFATRLSTSSDRRDELAVGARLRFLRVFYTHYFAERERISGSGREDDYRAPELGTANYLDKRGTALDVGVFYKPDRDAPIAYALVIENLREPNIEFPYTSPEGVAGTIKPIKRAIHLGIAMEGAMGVTYVADWVDVTNNLGMRELRFGAEKRLGGGLAVRAGYGSRSGWALGGEILGINIAVAQKFPLQVSRNISF